MQQVARGKRVHDEEVIAFIRSGGDPDERAPRPLANETGAREEAFRMGYRFEVFWTGYQAVNSFRLARTLYHRAYVGVIRSPMPHLIRRSSFHGSVLYRFRVRVRRMFRNYPS